MYTTVEDVSNELGGLTINEESTPSKSAVEEWIKDAEEEINEMTGMSYGVNVVPESLPEYHDYDGSRIIRLNKYPVISINKLEFNPNPLGEAPEWIELTEGYDGNFVVYPEEGVVKIHSFQGLSRTPVAGTRNLRVSYNYGTLSVPRTIKRLATLLVAKRVIQAVTNATAAEGGGSISVGTIAIKEPGTFILRKSVELNDEIDRLTEKVVGGLKAYTFYNSLRE